MNDAATPVVAESIPEKSELLRRLSYSDAAPSSVARPPFLLASPEALWLVEAGSVDILLGQVTLLGEIVERRYLFTAGTGQILCGLGISPLDNPAELFGSGSSTLRLRCVEHNELQLLARDGKFDEWFGQLVHSARMLLGPQELRLPEVPDFGSMLQAAEVEAALCTSQRQFLSALIKGQQQERARERSRLRALPESDARLLNGTLGTLGAVLADKAAAHSVIQDPRGPLYTTCKRVWRVLGIEVPALPSLGPQHRNRDAIFALAFLARLRVRMVMLNGAWWKHDHGPLVAVRKATGTAVALLPRGAHRYELCDDHTGTRELVTPVVARSLAPHAYSFYRKLKEESLEISDLSRFCLSGLRSELATVAVLGLGSGLLSVLPPYFSGLLFDAIIPGARRDQLLQLCMALLVAGVAASLFEFSRSLTIQRIEGKLSASLNAAIWDRLLALPVRFFRTFAAGDLAERAFGIQQIFRQVSGHTVGILLSGFYGLFNAGFMFYYDVRSAALALGLVLVTVAVTVISGVSQLRLQKTLAEKQGRISSLVLQLITGIPKLRVTGSGSRAFASWVQEYAAVRHLHLQARTPLAVFDTVYSIFALMVVYWLIGSAPGLLSAGRFLGFLAAFQGCLFMTMAAARALLGLANLIPVYHRLRPLLATPPEVEPRKAHPGTLTGAIEIAHLSFGYQEGGSKILNDVSLRIEAGEFVAITGPSGSGKSTLLRLLLGFEKPTAGAIYYDSQDLGSLDIGEVRRQLGVVLQDGRLMAGSIFENIVGSANLTPDDALEAARLAGFAPDLAQLPMGLHTHVEQGGATLSGGQRQRLLIARAIVHRPRILYFDEATSALDNQTQAAVAASIDGLAATRVIIAHRLSTIQNADRIVVLQAGRIVQIGTYRELIAQDGPFAELARRQLVESPAP